MFWFIIGTWIQHVAKLPRASIKERCCQSTSNTTRTTHLRRRRGELIEDGCALTHRLLLFLPHLLPFLPTSGYSNMKSLLQFPNAGWVRNLNPTSASLFNHLLRVHQLHTPTQREHEAATSLATNRYHHYQNHLATATTNTIPTFHHVVAVLVLWRQRWSWLWLKIWRPLFTMILPTVMRQPFRQASFAVARSV